MTHRDAIEPHEPVDPAAVAADDLLVEELLGGRYDRDDPVADLLATWRAQAGRPVRPATSAAPSGAVPRRSPRRSRSVRAGAVVAGVGLLVSTGLGQAVADDPVAPLRYLVTKGVDLGSGLGSPAEPRVTRGAAAGSADGGARPDQGSLDHEPGAEPAPAGEVATERSAQPAPGERREPRPRVSSKSPASPRPSGVAQSPKASKASKTPEAPEAPMAPKKVQGADPQKAPETDEPTKADRSEESTNRSRASGKASGAWEKKPERETDQPPERRKRSYPIEPEAAASSPPPSEGPDTEPPDESGPPREHDRSPEVALP